MDHMCPNASFTHCVATTMIHVFATANISPPHAVPRSEVPDVTVQENAGFVTIELPRSVQILNIESKFKLFTRDAGTGAGFGKIVHEQT